MVTILISAAFRGAALITRRRFFECGYPKVRRLFETRHLLEEIRYGACFERGVPWHSGKYRVWIHLEMPIWYDNNITVKCTVQISTHNKIWPIWTNGCVFVCELLGCGFESRWNHLNVFYCKNYFYFRETFIRWNLLDENFYIAC